MTVVGTDVAQEPETAPTGALLEARGVSKVFPGVRALSNVDFTLRGGEVHALVGENGAGKSTLMKVFAGLYQPDGGEVLQRGKPITLPTPLSAHLAGISVIHQEFFLMNHLTVAQNIFIGREPKLPGGVLNDDAALNRQAAELLERLGVQIDPKIQVGRLTVAQQQMVEIAKALSFDSSVLIMDEPTAALTETEVQTLFRIISGFVTPETAVVYISHRMEEIKKIATRVTILRDGELVDSQPMDDLTIPEIIHMMVGRKIASDVRPEPRAATEPVLRVEGLSTQPLLKDVSFTLERGEILGFAGLMGAGRTETARALIGADPTSSGQVTMNGRPVRISNPGDAVRLGIGYLSEDRKRYGLILRQDVAANTTLASITSFMRFGLLRDADMRTSAATWVKTLSTKTPSVRQLVRNLSGGNQQKVVLAKWLLRDCDILIFDEPTRGIDVGAKQEIYDLLDRLTKEEGKSIIMISSEMEEVLRMADRIAVMCNGRITGVLDNAEATQEKIMELATQFESVDIERQA
ncbi:sugar ABC transporter ATP-binding protein [Propionicicella superfundia]|uniref:sugar ABC transporter ATP-binding protein n=1 Tax=Propionicicella superfundia TaxID=348582 RepID=UPI00040666DC|nr:sugar ABC transporter ATP-binding protein [Propionicicella superfundia]